MAALEERIKALELGKEYDASKEAVRKVEEEFLIKLREIRASLAKEGSSAGNSKELEALREENAVLKKKNAKMEYRIKHMVHNMEQLYRKQKA